MKKTLILILILALSSTLLLSACAPDEPVTDEDLLYGKPRLSKMSDDEILKLMSKLKLSREYGKDHVPTIKSLIAHMEDDENHVIVLDSFNMLDLTVLFDYYYNYEHEWLDISEYIK